MESAVEIMGLWRLLALITVPGLFGGFVSALFVGLDNAADKEKKNQPEKEAGRDGAQKKRRISIKPSNKPKKLCCFDVLTFGFCFARALVGVAGAFGIVLFAIWLGKISFEQSAENQLVIISLSVLAGVISFRSLPIIGARLEEDFFNRRLLQVERDVEDAADMSVAAIDYSSVISLAETALIRQGLIDVPEAIHQIEEIEDRFPVDRRLHIYLGRLYRKSGDLQKKQTEYNSAITVLRNYIETLSPQMKASRHGSDIDGNIADALYNISCYHVLKAALGQESGAAVADISRWKKEALDALKESVNILPSNKESAKTDPDFDFIRHDEAFKAIVEV